MLTPEAKALTLDDRIDSICRDLSKLDPGPLAELRRTDTKTDEYGSPSFWRFCARYDLPRRQPLEQTWAQVIQALAILTPKGRDENKRSRHARRGTRVAMDPTASLTDTAIDDTRTSRRGLGHVLCDGGDPSWRPEDPANPKGMYSEARLAQLLGSSGATRVDLVLRLARMLVDRLPPEATFDCTDIARLLLYPEDPSAGRRISRDFYARLDGARSTADPDSDDTNSTGDQT